MKQEDRQHQIRRLPVQVLICLLAAANVSSGMVFCVGAAGHVAIEPLGHRHCDVAVHDHEHDVDARLSHEHDHGYGASQDCRPCVDIPLALGPLDEKTLSRPPDVAVTLAIADPSASLRHADASPDASDRTLLSSQQTALRSVVLQV